MEITSYRNPGIDLNRQAVPAGETRKRAGEFSGEDLRKKAQEFEAVLIEQMLKAVQPRGGLFGKGFQGDFYQSFFLREIAAKIAEYPGLGLAESIYRALKQEEINGAL